MRADRLARELEELSAAGIAVADQRVEEGDPVWDCVLTHDYNEITVSVRIRDGFPWLPPDVTSQEPFLERHQVPSRDGNFCLDRSDAPWWTPQHPIAILLRHLQGLLDADTEGALRLHEADMAEPASAFLSGIGFPVVLLTSTLLKDHLVADHGTLQLTRIVGKEARWLVTAIRAEVGDKLKLADEAQPSTFRLDKSKIIEVPWKNVGELRDRRGVEAARRAVLEMAPAPRYRRQRRPAPQQWRAITFMEEGPTKTRTRRAWAFARLGAAEPEWASTQALSVAERASRRIELAGLGDARVTMFGMGTVGGTMALHLAQAGVRDLHLVDHDEYDINNGVRHILPADALGLRKATAVADFLNHHQPFCNAQAHDLNVGRTHGSVDAAAMLIAESALVIDATGALLVSRLLGDLAARCEVPAIHCALLAGARYGYVFVRRQDTGCLDHFLKHRDVPLPPETDLPNTTPYACSHPAVSCAPFEPAQIALHGARAAAGVLDTVGYPAFEHDWLVTSLQHETLTTVGSLTKMAGCPHCNP